jgi:hypothetical protein
MSAEKYRRHAEQCFRTAERVTNSDTRLDLIELAQSWLLLAEQVEKNPAADSLYETPPSYNRSPMMQQQQRIQPKKKSN